jgi:hypothetical protein
VGCRAHQGEMLPGVTLISPVEDKMIECQIWPESGDFVPVRAVFKISPKVGETISVLIENHVRSFIVTGVSSDSEQNLRLWVRAAPEAYQL